MEYIRRYLLQLCSSRKTIRFAFEQNTLHIGLCKRSTVDSNRSDYFTLPSCRYYGAGPFGDGHSCFGFGKSVWTFCGSTDCRKRQSWVFYRGSVVEPCFRSDVLCLSWIRQTSGEGGAGFGRRNVRKQQYHAGGNRQGIASASESIERKCRWCGDAGSERNGLRLFG